MLIEDKESRRLVFFYFKELDKGEFMCWILIVISKYLWSIDRTFILCLVIEIEEMSKIWFFF